MNYQINQIIKYNDNTYKIVGLNKDSLDVRHTITNDISIITLKDIDIEKEQSLKNQKEKQSFSLIDELQKDEKLFSKYHKYVLLLIGFVLTCVSGFMTIIGFTNLFIHGTLIIGILFFVLEVTKFSIASILLNIDSKFLSFLPKIFLITMTFFLIVLSSIGHFNYLSSLYTQNQTNVTIGIEEKQNTQELVTQLKQQNNNYQKMINDIPNEMTSKKIQIIKELQPKIDNNNQKINELINDINTINNKNNNKDQISNNTMIYAAQYLGIEKEKLITNMILLLSIIIDPLAFGLTWCYGHINRRTKEK